MILQNTIEKMHMLKLDGMAKAFDEQLSNPSYADLSFEERVSMLIDREETHRENERMKRLLQQAKFRHHSACIEDVDYATPRGLEKRAMAEISNMTWVQKGQNILITGPTGTGKTWLACAIGNHACRQGKPTLFFRISHLLREFLDYHQKDDYRKLLKKLMRPDILILDDLGVDTLDSRGRNDLLEVIECRADLKSTIVTSQLPVENWHDYLSKGNKTVADAIMDRLVGGSLRLPLVGDSLRHQKLS